MDINQLLFAVLRAVSGILTPLTSFSGKNPPPPTLQGKIIEPNSEQEADQGSQRIILLGPMKQITSQTCQK